MKDRIRKLFTGIWNIPNVLTIFRLILVPVFVAVFRAGHPRIALGIFCLASLTDMLDGILARKLNQITDFGKLFDPLADKLMVLTALFCQGAAGVFPWEAIGIVLLKELVMMAGSVYMLGNGVVVSANYFGKVATVCFIISLILSFFHRELAEWGRPLDQYMLWISVGLCIQALLAYVAQSWKKIRAMKNGAENAEKTTEPEEPGQRAE